MSRPEVSSSSLIVSGMSRRMTLSCSPARSRASPRLWASLSTAAVSAGSGSRLVRLRTSSMAVMAPMPRTSPTQSYTSWIACMRRSASSPIRLLREQMSSRSMTSSTASAAAQATGLPPNVPPRPPGAGASISSARPTTAASGSPPPSDLARRTRSGSTPQWLTAKSLPLRPRPLWISSAINGMSSSRSRRDSRGMKSGGGTMNPPSPCTGSTITPATRSAGTSAANSAARASSVESVVWSRYGSGYGTWYTSAA